MYLRRTLLLLLLWPLLLFGQASENNEATPTAPAASPEKPSGLPPEEVRYRPIQFSIFVWPSNSIMLGSSKVPPVPRLFYDAPGGQQLITLSRNSSTPLFTYIGPQPLQLFDVEFEEIPPPEDAPPGTPPQYRPIRTPRIRVEVPEEFSRVTLVMMPGRTNPDGTILTFPLPYDAKILRPGMSRIYNTTEQNLVLQFEDDDGPMIRVNANRHVDFTPSDLADSHSVRVFGYALDTNGAPKRVHVSKISFSPDRTDTFILYPQGRRVRMMRIGSHEDVEPTPMPSPTPPPTTR